MKEITLLRKICDEGFLCACNRRGISSSGEVTLFHAESCRGAEAVEQIIKKFSPFSDVADKTLEACEYELPLIKSELARAASRIELLENYLNKLK